MVNKYRKTLEINCRNYIRICCMKKSTIWKNENIKDHLETSSLKSIIFELDIRIFLLHWFFAWNHCIEKPKLIHFRFNLALQNDEYRGIIDTDVQNEVLDWFHRMQNLIDASHSWYETSCRSLTEYWECDGNRLLNWKDHGYVTLFDLLQVSCNFESLEFSLVSI